MTRPIPAALVQVDTSNALEAVYALCAAASMGPDRPPAVHARVLPWLSRLEQHQGHPAYVMTKALLNAKMSLKDLLHVALLHGPFPRFVRTGSYPPSLLAKVPTRLLTDANPSWPEDAARLLDHYADLLRAFWADTATAFEFAALEPVAAQATEEVAHLLADQDLHREVSSLLGIAVDIPCRYMPVLSLPKPAMYGFELNLDTGPMVVLAFGYGGFPDAMLDAGSKRWLRLGSYHHLTQALLTPFCDDVRAICADGEQLMAAFLPETRRGYQDWYTAFRKHTVVALSGLLESRHSQRETRYSPGSGFPYAHMFHRKLAALLDQQESVPRVLTRMAQWANEEQEALLSATRQLGFPGPLSECVTPYWRSDGPPLLYTAADDPAQATRLTALAQTVWGDTKPAETPPAEPIQRPTVYVGTANHATIRSLLQTVDVTVGPDFVRVQNLYYRGEHLQFLGIGRFAQAPHIWWGIHCAWYPEHLTQPTPLINHGCDFMILHGTEPVGYGDYLLRT